MMLGVPLGPQQTMFVVIQFNSGSKITSSWFQTWRPLHTYESHPQWRTWLLENMFKWAHWPFAHLFKCHFRHCQEHQHQLCEEELFHHSVEMPYLWGKLEYPTKAVAQIRICHHLKYYHFAIWQTAINENKLYHKSRSGFGLAGIMRRIRFIELEEKDWPPKAAFICPLCSKALPKIAHGSSQGMAQALMRRSRKFHLKHDCQ